MVVVYVAWGEWRYNKASILIVFFREHTVQGIEGGMGMAQLLNCLEVLVAATCSARGHTSMQH